MKLRDEFLNGEIFYSLKEVQVLAERWRIHSNTSRPHSSLGYRSPAPETGQSEIKTGYGEVESTVRLPLPHTLDGGEISAKLAALNEQANWCKRSGRPVVLAGILEEVPYEFVVKSKEKDSFYAISKAIVHGADRMRGAKSIWEKNDIDPDRVKKVLFS